MRSMAVCGAVLLLAGGAPAVAAVEAGTSVPAVAEAQRLEPTRPWAYKRIERAYRELETGQYADLLDTLDEMRRNPKLNTRERALMWQAYAYAWTAQDRYPEAAAAMEQALAAGGLDGSATMQLRYNLAQIYVLLERPDEAIREFQRWFAAAPNPSGAAYYLYAMARVQQGDKDEALRLARRAVEQGGAEAREPWLQLVASLLIDRKDYAAAVPVLHALVERFPQKAYWLQLSAVHSALEQPDRALAVLELADRQGLLTERSELLTLAQLYLYNQIPAQAAAVIERGLRDGRLAPDARLYQLLADSLLHARQRERALEPLAQAAALADDGNAALRLAQLAIEREEWTRAREALALALAKGGLHSPGHAWLLLGIANANARRWDDAERAFRTAEAFEPVQRSAVYWIAHLAAQREREGERAHLAADAPAGRGNSHRGTEDTTSGDAGLIESDAQRLGVLSALGG